MAQRLYRFVLSGAEPQSRGLFCEIALEPRYARHIHDDHLLRQARPYVDQGQSGACRAQGGIRIRIPAHGSRDSNPAGPEPRVAENGELLVVRCEIGAGGRSRPTGDLATIAAVRALSLKY